jgi:AbrB family looped-hinge helix DNA binding protein
MAGMWYRNGMTTTIDKAGRVVIPAAIRERLGLLPGTPLTVVADDGAVTLTPAVPPPRLVRRHGRLVARPVGDRRLLPKIDIAQLIEEERNRWP